MRPSHSGKNKGRPVGWRDILRHWDLVMADLADVYGVHLWDTSKDTPWLWLKSLIAGLLTSDSRLSRALAPEEKPRR